MIKFGIKMIICFLFIISMINTIKFNNNISYRVAQFQTQVLNQDQKIQDIRNYISELNSEQNINNQEIVALNSIKSKIEQIDMKIDGLMCILKVSRDGKILESSGSSQEIFGFNNLEIIGKSISHFMTEQIQSKHKEILSTKFTARVLCNRPVIILNKNKQKISVELSVITSAQDYIVTIKRV